MNGNFGERRCPVPAHIREALPEPKVATNCVKSQSPLPATVCCSTMLSSLPMDAPDFRTVFAGVRPARVAVLVDQGDPEWQDTCRRIIECFASTWGGKYSIIVPIDGLKINSLFWNMLEAFDPDYICEYTKTGLDWKIGRPKEYEDLLQRTLQREYPNQTPPAGARAAIERALSQGQIQTVGITPELGKELKARLSPFYFEDRVIEYTSEARSAPDYPLTALSVILSHSQHSDRLVVTSNGIDGIPSLWVESILGGMYSEQMDRIAACGVRVEQMTLGTANVFELMAAQVGRDRRAPPDYIACSPFHFSMTALSEYRSLTERTWELPATVVAGSTFQDFALYFGLSRVRPRVCWLLPLWLDAFKAAKARAQGGGGAILPTEQHARALAQALISALAGREIKKIDFVSASLDDTALTSVIEDLDAGSGHAAGAIKSHGRVHESPRELFIHPRVVFNTDNFAIPTTQQVLEGKAVGFFPTPKPKGFTTIVPYEHRWITELRVEGLTYPRHPALGKWLVSHRMLGTQEARTGKQGLCYFCPSTAYFGGDVDTILLRPELRVPQAEAVFQRLAESVGASCKLSDKGFFSLDVVRKMGGLEYAAALIREPRHFAVLEAYLADAKSHSTVGRYLTSSSRRYLSLADVSTILGSAPEAVSLIDVLVGSGLMRRGVVLKCKYCRTADWFAMADLADELDCKRCTRTQTIGSKQTLGQAEPVWYYQLDEIAYLGIRNDMRVPLLALDYLRRKATSFSYAGEFELSRPNEPIPFIEIDLCCICDGTLTVGEAKATERIEGGGKRERRCLAKYREAATLLGARRFVLATSKAWSAETVANAKTAFAGTNVDITCLEGTQILSATS